MMDSTAVLEDVPDELLSLVLSSVPFEQRCGLSLVCTRWWRLLQQPGVHWTDYRLNFINAHSLENRLAWLSAGGGVAVSRTQHLTLAVNIPGNGECAAAVYSSVGVLISAFPMLQRLHFENGFGLKQPSRKFLDTIARHLPELCCLDVSRDNSISRMRPETATEMSRLTKLEELDLGLSVCSGVPDWLGSLRQLQRVSLLIKPDGGGLTEGLSSLARLTELDLRLTAGVEALGTAPLPPLLRRVALTSADDVDEEDWVSIMWPKLGALRQLRALRIAGRIPLDGSLHRASQIASLRHLSLGGCGVFPGGVLPTAVSMVEQLTKLSLDCVDVEDFSWGSVAQLMRLQEVDVRGSRFQGPDTGGFQLLAALPDLRRVTWGSIGMRSVAVTDEEAAHISAASADFNATYGDCLDAGGVHERVLRERGSPLEHLR